VKRQTAESTGWIKLCLDQKLLRRSVDRLGRAVDPKACFTGKFLKMPILGYLCRPTFGQDGEKLQIWGPQTHPTLQFIENKRVERAWHFAKAKKFFRINSAQTQRQSQEVI